MNPEEQPAAGQTPAPAPATPTPAPPPPAPSPAPVVAPSVATPPVGGAWPGGLNAIKQAASGIMANPVPAAIYVGVSFVLSVLAVVSHLETNSTTRGATGGVIGLVSLLFIRALVVYNLSVADRRPLSVSQFFAVNVKQFFSLIVAGIAAFIILIIAAIPILIPWIWVVPMFAVTGYVLVDKDLGPFAALGASRHLATHHKGKVWGIIGWIVLVGIVGALLGIIPYVSYLVQPALVVLEGATIAVFYRWLQAQPQPQASPPPPVQPNVAAA